MLQDLSNALETWDIDNKKEILPGTAEEKHILEAVDNKIVVENREWKSRLTGNI